jgi:phosphoribosyl 1,2-cyclic phosphodiesterase
MKIKTIASSSEGCCYVVESGGEQLLIECGIPLKKIREALNFDLSRVVGCLVSHEHMDHCLAINDIEKYFSFTLCAPLDLANQSLTCRIARECELIHCGNFIIKPVALQHDVECFGYVIKCGEDILFYATDTGEVNCNIPGLTHLMIEANYSMDKLLESFAHESVIARVSENHLSIDAAMEFALAHKKTLKEVHLLHLSDAHSDEEQFKRAAQELLGIPVYVAQK